MRIEHSLPPGFLGRRPVRVLVVGAGGTGSAILVGLPYLHQAMRVWGHPYGLEVCMMDADTVSETNCVRQPFSVSDIGQNKATVLVNRINMFWGTKWSAEPCFFNERSLNRSHDGTPDLLIGCVDTRAARKVIDQAVTRPMQRTTYWLDIGNNAPAASTSLDNRSIHKIVAGPRDCARSASCIPRSSMLRRGRTLCRVALPSKLSIVRSRSSTRRSPQVLSLCWRGSFVMESSTIMEHFSTPKPDV